MHDHRLHEVETDDPTDGLEELKLADLVVELRAERLKVKVLETRLAKTNDALVAARGALAAQARAHAREMKAAMIEGRADVLAEARAEARGYLHAAARDLEMKAALFVTNSE